MSTFGLLLSIFGLLALVLASVGLAGGVLAWLATPALASLLVGVGPGDVVTFATTALLLLTVAMGAAWIPARRAAGLSPVEALRAD